MIKPNEIVEKFNICSPEDIDLEAIAYHYGATVKYRYLENCAARIIGDKNSAIISIDKNTRIERQRFSVGHELGHWLNDRGHFSSCTENDLVKFDHDCKNREVLANRFSANLLMPDDLFKQYSKGMPIVFDSVRELSENFVTSLTATAIRLVEMGDFPSMITCYDKNGQRLWFFRNKLVPDYLWPNRSLNNGTIAYAIMRNNNPSSLPEVVDANEWVDHENAAEYVVKEHSIRGYDETIISLIWWEDESQLVDLS